MVENIKPKAIEVAIGIRNWACNEVSNNNGVKPAIVVNEVNKTALRRCDDALINAVDTSMPLSLRCL